MKRSLLLLLFVLPVCFGFSAHKYYLSVTDIIHNQETQSLEIITRLFYDDLQKALQERYDENIVVDETADQKLLDYYIAKYMAAKLEISWNDTPQIVQFIGKEFEDDFVVVYTEIQALADVQQCTIENTLLMDVFPEQKNMVHTEIAGKKRSFVFVAENAKGVLNFSE